MGAGLSSQIHNTILLAVCLFFFQPKPAYKCLKSMLGDNNNNRYFVATQDPALRDKCRKIPGTPILYLHHCAPVLEKPSEMSETQANKAVGKKHAPLNIY